MFARLSHHSARWFKLRVDHPLFKCESEDALIDLSLASSLVPVDLSWRQVMALCEKSVFPAYRSLMGVLEQDIEHLSKLLLESPQLEVNFRTECAASGEQPCSPFSEPAFASQGLHSSDSVNPERRKRKRRRSSTLQEPVTVRPIHSFAPTIIITPSPPQSEETSCWVPCQDASFGTRLTVPAYTVLNIAHPPMVAPAITIVIQTDRWEYVHGHWHAVIPPPDEQCRRRMFSGTLLSRRKAGCRPPSRTGNTYL